MYFNFQIIDIKEIVQNDCLASQPYTYIVALNSTLAVRGHCLLILTLQRTKHKLSTIVSFELNLTFSMIFREMILT